MTPKFPKVYLAIAATLLLALTVLGILRFGNPQWHKFIYIFQAYYWPGYENENIPILDNYFGEWSS